MLCVELLMDLLLRMDVDVTAGDPVGRTGGEALTFPIRFLLRQAQKRAQDLPKVRQAIPSTDLVFVKTGQMAGRPAPRRWGDMRLGAGERQVYVFVDGRRTVADLALATCQSEFKTAKALVGLAEQGLVQRETRPRDPTTRAGARPDIGRPRALLVTAVILVVAAAATRLVTTDPSAEARQSFAAVAADSSSRRLIGAVRLYRLLHGVPPESFDDLLRERFIEVGDVPGSAP